MTDRDGKELSGESALRQAQRQAAVEDASAGVTTHTGVLGMRLRERLTFPTNIDFHLFRARDGGWRVRVDGLGPQVILGKDTSFVSPSSALEGAAIFVRAHMRQVDSYPKSG